MYLSIATPYVWGSAEVVKVLKHLSFGLLKWIPFLPLRLSADLNQENE